MFTRAAIHYGSFQFMIEAHQVDLWKGVSQNTENESMMQYVLFCFYFISGPSFNFLFYFFLNHESTHCQENNALSRGDFRWLLIFLRHWLLFLFSYITYFNVTPAFAAPPSRWNIDHLQYKMTTSNPNSVWGVFFSFAASTPSKFRELYFREFSFSVDSCLSTDKCG